MPGEAMATGRDALSAHADTRPLWRMVLNEPLAIGVALVVFFRPWRDGITYHAFNTYFLWATLILAALWGARLLMRGRPLRFPVPVLLFALFLAIAFVTGLGTVQVDATYRGLIYWFGYFLLFAICVDAVRTPLALGLVLGAFVVSGLANAIWGILHFEYILPLMREQVAANPDLLRRAVGGAADSPELLHRLQVNRAYGTWLFPNAFAAFLVLSIPFVLGEIWPTAAAWRQAWADRKAPQSSTAYERSLRALAVCVTAWLIAFATIYFIYPFVLAVVTRDDNWLARPVLSGFLLGLVPMAIAVGSFIIVRIYGLRFYRLTLQAVVLPVTLVVQLFTLWLTFSRGGMLALVGALLLGGALFLIGSGRRWQARVAAASVTVIFILAFGFSAGVLAQDNPGQTVSPSQATPSTTTPGGIDVGARELADTATFRLRLTYWKVAWNMIRDNFWTGVGLDCFGKVYAKYQYIGAGPTQAAHNSVLQTWAETGIFGVLAFCAFWGYFLIWGGWRIIREGDAKIRAVLTGLYAGVAAFLAHSLVDFNFYNPALVTLVVVMTGLFYSRTAAALVGTVPTPSDVPKQAAYQLIALPVLVPVALVAGASARVFIIDFALTDGTIAQRLFFVGDRKGIHYRIDMARYLIKDLQEKGFDASRPPLYSDMILLIPSPERLSTFGVVRVPQPGNPPSLRPLAEGEPPPQNALFYIRDPRTARKAAFEASEAWLEQYALIDGIYPYIPDLALAMFEWYSILQDSTDDAEQKKKYIDGCVSWARAEVERNPEQAWSHEYLGQALFMLGTQKAGQEAVALYREGVQKFRDAKDLYPVSDRSWSQLASALTKVGEAFVKSGLAEEGNAMIAEGKRAQAKAAELRAMWSG